jgi:hypothetical protein
VALRGDDVVRGSATDFRQSRWRVPDHEHTLNYRILIVVGVVALSLALIFVDLSNLRTAHPAPSNVVWASTCAEARLVMEGKPRA